MHPQYWTKEDAVPQGNQATAPLEGGVVVHRGSPENFDKTPGLALGGKPTQKRGPLGGLAPAVHWDLRPGPMGPEAADLLCGRANFLPDLPSNMALHKPRLRPVDNNPQQAVSIPVGSTPAHDIHTLQQPTLGNMEGEALLRPNKVGGSATLE